MFTYQCECLASLFVRFFGFPFRWILSECKKSENWKFFIIIGPYSKSKARMKRQINVDTNFINSVKYLITLIPFHFISISIRPSDERTKKLIFIRDRCFVNESCYPWNVICNKKCHFSFISPIYIVRHTGLLILMYTQTFHRDARFFNLYHFANPKPLRISQLLAGFTLPTTKMWRMKMKLRKTKIKLW